MTPPEPRVFDDDVPRPGDVVAGKYRVVRIIGRGGMGVVVAADHLELHHPVALKFLHPVMAARPELVRRFLREGQAAARLRSEHAARVIDVGRTDGGQPFLVMELLDGIDLAQKLKRDGPLPVPDVALYVIQTCAAIGEAHGLGIVHRDLKPANLFLARRPDGTPLVKVVDFGVSKIVDPGGEVGEVTLTTGGDVLGSPLYMAPEQIRTPHGVDGRADLWSLGAILHRLISGKSAFGAESAGAVLAAIVADPPTPLRVHAPHAPAELEAIVGRCLTRDLDARWQTAADLADALRPFVPAAGAVVVPVQPAALARVEAPIDPAPGPEPITIAGGSVSSVAAAPDRRRLVSSVVLAVALALVGVGIAASTLMAGADPERAPASGGDAPGRATAAPPADPASEPTIAPGPSASVVAPVPSASAAPSGAARPSSAAPRPPAPASPPRSRPDPLDDRL